MCDRAKLARVDVALKRAYEQAIYEVYYGQETLKIYIGKRCPPIDDLIVRGNLSTWALITAANPYSQPLSELENQQRHHQLIKHLEKLKLSWLPALGKDLKEIWTPEQSLLIFGIERSLAIAIGRKFEQNAIVYGKLNHAAELQWL
jgi:hypothetical protein